MPIGSRPGCNPSGGHPVASGASPTIAIKLVGKRIIVDYEAPNYYCQDTGDWPPGFTSVQDITFGWGDYLQVTGPGGLLAMTFIYYEKGEWDTGVDLACGSSGSYTAKINFTADVRSLFASNTQTLTVPAAPNCLTPDHRSCPVSSAGAASQAGHPINVGSGDVTTTIPLFTLAQSPLSLSFNLTYHSSAFIYPSLVSSPVGLGWTHPYSQTLRTEPAPRSNVLYHITGEGYESEYTQNGSVWTASSPGELRGTVTADAPSSEYRLQDLDGTVTGFDQTTGRWKYTKDRWNNQITGGYDASGNLTSLTDAENRTVTLVYNATNQVWTIHLPDGEIWTLDYTGGSLISITDPIHTSGHWRSLGYQNPTLGNIPLLLSITDDAGALLEGHSYGPGDRGATSYAANNRSMVTVNYDTTLTRTVTSQIQGSLNQVSTFLLTYQAGRWLPVEIIGPCSTCSGAGSDTQSFMYYADNHLSTVTDGKGNVTTFDYNNDGNVNSMTEAFGTGLSRTTTWDYANPSWPNFWTMLTVPSTYGTHSKTTIRSWGTDETGKTTLTTTETGYSAGSPVSYITTQTFDTKHRLTAVNGPRTSSPDSSHITSYAYFVDAPPPPPPVPNNAGRLSSVTDAVSLQTTFADYDIYGTAKTTTDPNGAQTLLTTDARGRVLTRTLKAISGDSEPANYVTTYVFDGRDRLTSIQIPRSNSTAYVYEDGTNRLTQTIRRDTSGNEQERLLYTLNDIGGRTEEDSQICSTPAAPCGSWATPPARSEKFTYDSKNRLSQVLHPVPAPADSTKIVYTYDSNGLLSTVQDERHTAANTTYTYDALNRLKQVTQTLTGAPSNQIQTVYGYDVGDNLTSVTDPNGNATTYVFDDFHRMTSQTSPASGYSTYTYDAFGNPYDTTDANGALTRRLYDYTNRLWTATSTRTGFPTEVVTNTYDDVPSNYGQGRLKSSSVSVGEAATASNAYTYDRRGLVRRDTSTLSGHDYLTWYGYDGNGNRTHITYPSGRVVDYTFDFADRPLSASSTTPVARTYVSAASPATYYPFGPLKSMTFGNNTGWSMTYDQRYRPLTLAASGVSGVSYTYTPDPAGSENITGITDNGNTLYNRTFGYDDLNRLTSATTGGNPPLWGSTGAFTYDPLGNRKTMTLGSRSVSYAYDAVSGHDTSRLKTISEGPLSVTHDAAGNETNMGTTPSTYSPRNLLALTSGTNLAYDGRGVRVQESFPPAAQLSFYTLTPCRLVDTRAGSGFPSGYGPPSIAGGTSRTFTITGKCVVPTGAQAVSFNFTVWNTSTYGDLKVYPAGGTVSSVSTLNWAPNTLALANAAIVPLGANGGITVVNEGSGTVDLFVDVNGYFAAPGQLNELGYVEKTPCRVADTRSGSGFPTGYGQPSIGGGVSRDFTITGQCGIPAGAQAVSFNFAVWNTTSYGDLKVYPTGPNPSAVSTLNWAPGTLALANAAIVPLGANGGITVVNEGSGTVDIFFDINGYFLP